MKDISSIVRGLIMVLFIIAGGCLAVVCMAQSTQPSRPPEPPFWRQFVFDGDPVVDWNNPIDAPKRVWCMTNWTIPGYVAKVPDAYVGRYVRIAAAEPIDKPIEVWQDSPIVRDTRWFLRNADGSYASWSQAYPSPILDISQKQVRRFQVAWWLMVVKQARGISLDEGGFHPDTPLAKAVRCDEAGTGAMLGLDGAVNAQLALVGDYIRERGLGGPRITFNLGTDDILRRWAQLLAELEPGDGLMDETGFAYPPSDMAKRPAWFKQRIDAWRLALDHGCEVLVTSYGVRSLEGAKLLYAAICLTYKPGEERRLLGSPAMTTRGFSPNIEPDRKPYSFYYWQRDLGPPKGPAVWVGSAVLRVFQGPMRNNYVMVNLGVSPPVVYVEINGREAKGN